VAAAQPRHPNPQLRVAADGVAYVAYATETAGGAKTVAVASRCPGAAFVDTGLVDDVGEQGFGVATDGTIENRAFLTSSSLTVDDDGGTVHLAWVRRSEGRSVAVEGWRDLASCE
jgi:hypothetical protein